MLSIVACGAGASLLLPEYLIRIRRVTGSPMRVLLTHSAQRFVQPQAVKWIADETILADDPSLNPTEFALKSTKLVVLPATANMLASAALGLAGTPAQTVLLAYPEPVLFFPGMHQNMWDNPRVKQHVTTLRGDGHAVVDPHQRDVFELWQREIATAPTLPPPDDAAKTILDWLGD